jgi:hypothetical protein
VRLERLAGPFDDPPAAGAGPATPTCCCCCCCLVTTLTASTVAAVTVHREAEISELGAGRRRLLTVAAAVTVLLGLVPAFLAGLVGTTDGLQNVPDGVLVAALVLSIVGTWLVWLRAVLGWAGAAPRPAWWWSARFTMATAVVFTAELFTLGFVLYGQLAALPVAVVVGVVLRRRLTAAGR